MQNREIVIVDKDAARYRIKDKNLYRNIWCVPEDPTFRDVLRNAIGTEDTHAIIMAKTTEGVPSPNHVDARSIETALAIEALDVHVYTIVEVLEPNNTVYLGRTMINEWICIKEYGVRLISQCALQPGVADVIMKLLGEEVENDNGPSESDSIRLSGSILPDVFIKAPYRKATDLIRRNSDINVTPIGFAKYVSDEEKRESGLTLRNTNYFFVLNPKTKDSDGMQSEKNQSSYPFLHRDTLLEQYDRLIYIANAEVDFDKHFSRRFK